MFEAEIAYRVPGVGTFKRKVFRGKTPQAAEAAAQRGVEKLIEKHGSDVEVRWSQTPAVVLTRVVIQTARCDERGGLMLEGSEGCPARIACSESVPAHFDFSDCYFGPGAADRLETLRLNAVQVSAPDAWPQTLHIGDRLQVQVSSLQEARTVYERERDASGEGSSTWPRGRVGTYDISYNGRVWLDGKAVSL